MNLVKQVTKTAKKLIETNGTVSTLEIKTELRNKYPGLRITQQDVSDAMISVYNNELIPHLGYTDNGVHRIYTIPGNIAQAINRMNSTTQISVSPVLEQVTKTRMAELLYDSDGDMVTVTYDKKDGDRRTMIGTTNQLDYFNSLGYVKILEFGQTFKLVDPRTIVAIYTNGVMYTLK